jgi:hypothetical protein
MKSKKINNSKSRKIKHRSLKLKSNLTFKVCSRKICFDDETLNKLRYLSDYNYNHDKDYNRIENKEVSGKLIAKKENGNYILHLDEKFNLKNLQAHEAEFIDSHYNFHTHPLEAYLYHNCDLGWPSKDDFVTFLDGFLNYNVIFHCVATVEGLYIMSINKTSMIPLREHFDNIKSREQDSFIEDVDSWVMKHLNIDKFNYKMSKGYKPSNYDKTIHTPKDYVKFINCFGIKYSVGKRNIKIFKLQFLSWDELKRNKCFTFNFISKKGNCPVTLQEYRNN